MFPFIVNFGSIINKSYCFCFFLFLMILLLKTLSEPQIDKDDGDVHNQAHELHHDLEEVAIDEVKERNKVKERGGNLEKGREQEEEEEDLEEEAAATEVTTGPLDGPACGDAVPSSVVGENPEEGAGVGDGDRKEGKARSNAPAKNTQAPKGKKKAKPGRGEKKAKTDAGKNKKKGGGVIKEVYTVDSIIADRQDSNGKSEYCTVWVGYDDPTWEPEESFEMAKRVLREYRDQKKLTGSKRRREGEDMERANDMEKERKEQVDKLTKQFQNEGKTFYKAYEAANSQVR